MREHFGLDRLIEYGTEPVPDAIHVVNPEWRKLDARDQEIRSCGAAHEFGQPAQTGAQDAALWHPLFRVQDRTARPPD